jgi:hypothetical protein
MYKEDKLWQYIKDIYKDKLGIPEKIVNLLSDDKILIGVATGLSNRHICNYVDLDEKLVKTIVEQYFKDISNFSGWQVDLDFSPIMVYNNKHTTLYGYIGAVKEASSLVTENDVYTSYQVCVVYKNYEEELAKYGYVTK